MLKFKSITAKNFMSIGNQTQAINLLNDQITLILGDNLDQGGDDAGSRNGVGKTAMLNAISYGIFGQALTNIKRDNLINNINQKNMLVTLTFEKNGTTYRIERGRKPTLLRFYVNDNEQEIDDIDESQGDSRKTQESINELIGMSHTMFKHIVALNTYTEPFLSLRASEQREVIEQLLGITLLSEKAEMLKEQIKATKDSIIQETAKIEAIKTSNTRIEETIKSLKLKQSAWKTKQKEDCSRLNTAISQLREININAELENHAALKLWQEKNDKIKSFNKEKSSLESALIQAQKVVDKINADLKKTENYNCHACGQELHDEQREKMVKKLKKEFKDSEAYLIEVKNKLDKINKDLESVGEVNPRPNTFYDRIEDAYDHKNNLENLEKKILDFDNDIDPYKDQIVELENTAIQEIDWSIINQLDSFRGHQDFLLKLLTNKDSFIRKKIIDQNLNYLNQRLTYYLDKTGLPHQVTFNNDLSTEITQLGQDLDFDNLSRGERNRLTLSLSWAFRDTWENLFHPINLLFVDELLDNGLDPAGVENSLAILKKMVRDRNKNIYLISHKDELIGRVNNVLKVIKENGFTTYSNDIDIID